MKLTNSPIPAKIHAMLFVALIVIITGCDRTSSPEGRMSIKLENLQKEMIDSLRQQNRAIMDSLGNIRRELNEIRQQQANGN